MMATPGPPLFQFVERGHDFPTLTEDEQKRMERNHRDIEDFLGESLSGFPSFLENGELFIPSGGSTVIEPAVGPMPVGLWYGTITLQEGATDLSGVSFEATFTGLSGGAATFIGGYSNSATAVSPGYSGGLLMPLSFVVNIAESPVLMSLSVTAHPSAPSDITIGYHIGAAKVAQSAYIG